MMLLFHQKTLIIAEKIKNSWLVQINRAGHGLMYQYPEQFTGIVKTFFTNTTRFNSDLFSITF